MSALDHFPCEPEGSHPLGQDAWVKCVPVRKKPVAENITIESVDWFTNTVIRDMVEEKDRWAWILGAGASKESNIPLAWELAQKWAMEMFGIEHDETSDEFRSELAERKWSFERLDQHYFQIYDARFPSAAAGYKELLDIIKDKTPSYGYFVLAHLLSTTPSNLTITVNFDNLIANAIYLAGKGYPLILDHEGVAHLANPMTSVPMVFKIHRDLTKGPLNRTDEMFRLDGRWDAPLGEMLRYYTPIFLGYGGNDHTLMRYLNNFEGSFPGRPIWLTYTQSGNLSNDDIPIVFNDGCLAFLRKSKGIVVPFSSFDVLMELIRARFLSDVDICSQFEDRTSKIKLGLEDRVAQLGRTVQGTAPADPVVTALREEDPKTAFDWFIRGATVADLPEQIVCYDRAIELDPNYFYAYANRGYAMNELKRYREAIADLDRAIALDPAFPVTYNNRGYSKNQLGEYEGAIADLTRSLELDSSNAWTFSNRGYANLRLGNFDLAMDDLNKSILLNPALASPYYHQACLLALRGSPEAAINSLREAVKLDPEYRALARSSPDFQSLRDEPEFIALLDSQCESKEDGQTISPRRGA